jgi:hypothetical protein
MALSLHYLSSNFISSIGVATGRGSHLTSDAGFLDSSSSSGVQILRPMKEFSDEEIRIFNDGDDAIGGQCFLLLTLSIHWDKNVKVVQYWGRKGLI